MMVSSNYSIADTPAPVFYAARPLLTHRSWYATSDNIYGPYTYRGQFTEEPYNDHGTFFTCHNQTYYIYGVPEDYHEEPFDHFCRTTKIVYIHFRDNGEIVRDLFIEKAGVGRYDASWEESRGEWYFAASDGLKKKERGDAFEIRSIRNGAYLYYPNIANMRQNARLILKAAPVPGTTCGVEIREGSPFGPGLPQNPRHRRDRRGRIRADPLRSGKQLRLPQPVLRIPWRGRRADALRRIQL